jgi:hypothetical protein
MDRLTVPRARQEHGEEFGPNLASGTGLTPKVRSATLK